MRTLILILAIVSFLQTTILPINLVLIILICRSYIGAEKENLILAFSFGLLISHLNLHPLGLDSVIYLILIQITQVLPRSPFSKNALFIIPISLFLFSLNNIAISLITHVSITLMPQVLIEGLLSLPIFYLVRVWEERFIVRKEVKLRV